MIAIPRAGRGRRTAGQEIKYQKQLASFYKDLMEINSTVDFTVSSRGWNYLLEEHGLTKGEFRHAEKLINSGRGNGGLPTDICGVDQSRELTGIEIIDSTSPREEAEYIIGDVVESHISIYRPESRWDTQKCFVIMAVEKKDLIGIFQPVCKKYGIPIANFKGWTDKNSRIEFMRLFAEWEGKGKKCVLLYCGDHDPGGLHISGQIKKNMADLTGTYSLKHGPMDWFPENLIVDRFGLNYDFIQKHKLSWVNNLITGSGNDLASSRCKEHPKPYVQDYLEMYGSRKVEANALVTRIDKGRQLCKEAILKYIDTDALDSYYRRIEEQQDKLRKEVAALIE